MDEQTLMAINAYPHFQDYYVQLISPAIISSISDKSVSMNKEESNDDPANRWSSQLPTDLLNLIMRRLSSMADFSTFRAVCPTWRSLATPCPENFDCQSPLLLLASSKKDMFGFYDFTRKRLYDIRLSIQNPQEPEKPYSIDYFTHLSYSHGFLVIANMPGFTDIMLCNIFTGNRIMLPAVKQTTCDHRFIFSSSPASPGCLVIKFLRRSSSFYFCCIGDLEWKHHYLNGCPLIYDMVFFNGKLFALTSKKQLISICFARCLKQILVEKVEQLVTTIFDRRAMMSKWHLAQSCSELLVLQQGSFKHTDRLNIYRWDFDAGAWTEVSSLGGRALFFSTNGFMASVPSTSFGVRANSIYYFSPGYYPEIRKNNSIIWSEFSMEDGTIRTVCHELPIKEFSSSVTWILPSMS